MRTDNLTGVDMTLSIFVVLVYGLFTLIGGIIGYTKAQSKASLVAGSLSGSILIFCGYGMTQGVRAAYLLTLVVSILLGIRFFKTWRVKKRLMPDLLMVILSDITFILVGLQMIRGW